MYQDNCCAVFQWTCLQETYCKLYKILDTVKVTLKISEEGLLVILTRFFAKFQMCYPPKNGFSLFYSVKTFCTH